MFVGLVINTLWNPCRSLRWSIAIHASLKLEAALVSTMTFAAHRFDGQLLYTTSLAVNLGCDFVLFLIVLSVTATADVTAMPGFFLTNSSHKRSSNASRTFSALCTNVSDPLNGRRSMRDCTRGGPSFIRLSWASSWVTALSWSLYGIMRLGAGDGGGTIEHFALSETSCAMKLSKNGSTVGAQSIVDGNSSTLGCELSYLNVSNINPFGTVVPPAFIVVTAVVRSSLNGNTSWLVIKLCISASCTTLSVITIMTFGIPFAAKWRPHLFKAVLKLLFFFGNLNGRVTLT